MKLPPEWNAHWRPHLPEISPARAERLLSDVRDAVTSLQRAASEGGATLRGAHARGPWSTTEAIFEVDDGIAPELSVGPFARVARWRAIVRFSNAAPLIQPDDVPSQRGMAVRIVGDGRAQDLMLVDGSEGYHARDAEAHIALVRATCASIERGAAAALVATVGGAGIVGGVRMLRTTKALASSGVSLACTEFFSRAPFQLGPFAVKYRLRPESAAGTAVGDLGDDLAERRARAELSWRVEVHAFVSPERTPLDDHRTVWDSPWVALGRVRIPRAAVSSETRTAAQAATEAMGFSPGVRWTEDDGCLLPLGDINLLRQVYESSVKNSGRLSDALRRCPSVPGS